MSAFSGSSAYQFLILSGLVILLGAALARRGSGALRGTDRWAIAAGMLVGLQGLRLITSLWAPASVYLPLLDRLFSVLLPSLLGWAALGPEAGERADRILTGIVVVAATMFAGSVFLASTPSDFNMSVFDEVWSLAALAAAGGALLAVVTRRPPQWGVFGGALAVLVTGDLAHIVTIPFTSSSAPYVLLGEALAVPLFTVGAVWSFLREPVSPDPGLASAEAFPAPKSLSAFVELEAAESADAYAALLTQAVAWLLQAEYCLLLTTPAPDGELAIGAGYDTTLRKPVIAMPLDALQVPVLVQAMTLGRSVHLPGGTHSPDARSVLRSLGLAGKSPALLVPLTADGRTVAGLLLLSPRAQRVWDDATRLALEQVAPRMGERLQHWIEHSTLREASEASLDIEQARRRIAELESRLERAIAQPTDLIGVDELRNELDDARLAIDMLESEVERLRSASSTLAAPTASVGGSTPRQDSERLQAELTLALQALAEARASTASAGAAPGASPEAHRALPASIHGARQPLTTISGYTELLLGESIGLLGSTQRRFLERIRAAVRRIDEELNSLAESLPGYEAAPTQAAHDLGALIEQALEVIQQDLRAKGLSVRLDLPPTPVRVPGDATSIRTIVSRLLANAADVTPAGREILLSVLPGAGDGVVLLTVSDLGRGVAPTDLGRVFSGDIWTDPVPGLGRDSAGLAMVKTLSESLGGRVWVESRPGGTTFSVLLPSASGTPV